MICIKSLIRDIMVLFGLISYLIVKQKLLENVLASEIFAFDWICGKEMMADLSILH